MEKDGKKRRHVIFKEKKISRDEFMAASIGDCEWLEQSLRDGHNPSTFDRHGLAPIHLAALHGRLRCLKLLVEKYKVDVNLPSSNDWRPLHLAINKEIKERALLCVNYLLENGADVNCVNSEKVTVTHQAATAGLVDCLYALLSNNAPIEALDSRKQTPYDLARLWGHKECARLIQLEDWKRQKELDKMERKKLDNLKNKYKELQQEALHQLQNEQEFYDSVIFGNWLDERGFTDNFSATPKYVNKRHSEHVTKGLAQRLKLGAPMMDYATRVENMYVERKSLSTYISSTQRPKESRMLGEELSATKTKSKSKATKEKKTSISKRQGTESSTSKDQVATPALRKPKTSETKPNKYASSVQREEGEWKHADVDFPMNLPDWNFSTNVNTPPVTNIRNPQSISLSTKPSEDAVSIIPPTANLSLSLEMDNDNNLALKVLRPGGVVENPSIAIPSLPAEVIRKALYGKGPERIRIPQEFESVHIFDVKHKGRAGSALSTEVPWHLKMFKDGRCIECDCTQQLCDAKNSC